jgi:uncharacterized membrane protein YkoI
MERGDGLRLAVISGVAFHTSPQVSLLPIGVGATTPRHWKGSMKMKRIVQGMSAIAGLGLIVVATSARAADEKVPLDQVPKPVMATAKSKYPGAEIKSAVKEVEDGKTTYELTLKDKGNSIDLVVKPDGTLVAIEKLIDAKALPKAVATAINAKYPGATIKKAEEITVGDVISYEVGLTTADKKSAGLTLDPKGKILEVE